ncbi:MAG: ROK family protein [Myxococcota bacterium]
MKLGVDLGGTRIKAGLVTDDGHVHTRAMRATPDDRSVEAVVESIVSVVADMAPHATTVGLAAAGVMERSTGLIRESPNFPAWRDVPLGAHLARRLELPVNLDNDANAVVFGEARHGAGQGASSLIGYALGTGVGGAVVLNGRLWRGVRGMAGELGHAVVVRDGHPCGCGGRGCLEQYAGAVGLWRQLAEHGYTEYASGVDGIRLASEAARAGDTTLRELFKSLGSHLGVAIAGAVHALDVQRVVLAGGLTGASDLFLEATYASMRRHAFPSVADGVEIVVGTLGEDAGVIGAAALE